MLKYEYNIFDIGETKAISELNKYAKQGWECVTHCDNRTRNTRFIFKRRIEDSKTHCFICNSPNCETPNGKH